MGQNLRYPFGDGFSPCYSLFKSFQGSFSVFTGRLPGATAIPGSTDSEVFGHQGAFRTSFVAIIDLAGRWVGAPKASKAQVEVALG